jgi:hypothetical protein
MGPLAQAASGASYSGAFGTQGGDLARAAAAFMSGRREEEEARRKAAMDAALQQLRERELAQGEERIGVDREQMKQQGDQFRQNLERSGADLAGRQVEMGLENERGKATLAQQASENEKNRQNQLEIAKIGAQSRETVASMRTIGSGKDYVVKEDSQGRVWRVNKVTGDATEVKVQGQGQPAQGDGQQLIGAGGRPSQGERDAAGVYNAFKSTSATLQKNMQSVGGKAPGIGQQLLIDGTKSSGLGPVSSLVRSLSNSAMDPQYQLVQNSLDATGSLFVKLMTGAQMSEPEALRLFNVIGPKAGDEPATVQQKMQQLDDIVRAQYVKVGRAAELDGNGLPPTTAPVSGGAPSAPTGARKKYILPDGTVAE